MYEQSSTRDKLNIENNLAHFNENISHNLS